VLLGSREPFFIGATQLKTLAINQNHTKAIAFYCKKVYSVSQQLSEFIIVVVSLFVRERK